MSVNYPPSDADEAAYDKLVAAVARRFTGRGTEYEELYQAGYLGLLTALSRFDAEKGTPFAAFAFSFIEGEIRRFIRENSNIRVTKYAVECRKILPFTVSLDAEDADISERKIKYFEPSFENDVIRRIDFKKLLNALDETERRIIELRYTGSYTQEETGKIMNISQSRVSRIEKNALMKLRDAI